MHFKTKTKNHPYIMCVRVHDFCIVHDGNFLKNNGHTSVGQICKTKILMACKQMLRVGGKHENLTIALVKIICKTEKSEKDSKHMGGAGMKEKTINYLPAVIGVTPTLHRSLPNIELPHNPSLIAIFVIFAPNGGSPCEGNNAPRMFFMYVDYCHRNLHRQCTNADTQTVLMGLKIKGDSAPHRK